jgi:chromosome segregation ATPase
MSKWLIWALLELSTFLLLANCVFLWLSHSLSKKKVENQSSEAPSNNTLDDNSEIDDSNAYKGLAHYLDLQINFAASSITPNTLDQHEINRLKIWGTVLKAERAILLNQASEKPKPILNRFLSSLLYALSAPKLQTTNPDELHQNLKDMEDEFYQATEILITKESLSKNQALLNEDLRKNIDRATTRIRQLEIKKAEHQRLEIEISDLQKKIKNLEQKHSEHTGHFADFSLQAPTAQKHDKASRNASFKQISSLSSLSDRQRMVIEQLKNEIDKAYKNNNSHAAIEAQKIAITKMERMSKESQNLILQLEAELETSNLSILSLRQDINAKDAKLAELEKQLSKSNETAIGNLQALSANKKETLVSLRDGLNTALENRSSDNLIEQDKDAKMLERLLHESETCVTLLAQELETAEKTNDELKQRVQALTIDSDHLSANKNKPLMEQREKNRELVQKTTELKNKLVDIVSSKDYQSLRVTYNKKSLECDRLQLAYSDLEMKYLGTLNN